MSSREDDLHRFAARAGAMHCSMAARPCKQTLANYGALHGQHALHGLGALRDSVATKEPLPKCGG